MLKWFSNKWSNLHPVYTFMTDYRPNNHLFRARPAFYFVLGLVGFHIKCFIGCDMVKTPLLHLISIAAQQFLKKKKIFPILSVAFPHLKRLFIPIQPRLTHDFLNRICSENLTLTQNFLNPRLRFSTKFQPVLLIWLAAQGAESSMFNNVEATPLSGKRFVGKRQGIIRQITRQTASPLGGCAT